MKAIELGGQAYCTPKFILFAYYFQVENFEKAYKIGIVFLKNRFQTQEYWAIAIWLFALYYGHSIEYKNAIKKYINVCINNKEYPNYSNLFLIITSLYFIFLHNYLFKKYKSSESAILNSLVDGENYELVLALSNKLITRKDHEKRKNNSELAYLYLIKAKALMYKEKPEYKQAMQTLEKFKEYTDDLRYYYYTRAKCAYLAHDYKKALIYVNEAILNCINGATLELKGCISHASGQYEKSKDALIKALDYDDCNIGNVNYYLCEDYYALGEYNDALKCINQALLFEQTSLSYYAKANILEALGKTEEAVECFKKYKEYN